MTALDIGVIVVIALSTLLAFVRGVVRELLALASWIAAVVLAFAYVDRVAPMLPPIDAVPAAQPVAAFALIVVAVLVAGALVALLMTRLIRIVGLGFVDRLLGAVFGLGRGLAIVLLGVLVAGLTALPRQDWWQNSVVAPPLATAALALRSWLPPVWADRLDFSRTGRRPARPGAATAAIAAGDPDRCAES